MHFNWEFELKQRDADRKESEKENRDLLCFYKVTGQVLAFHFILK